MDPFLCAAIRKGIYPVKAMIALCLSLVLINCHHEDETDYFIDSKRELTINLAEPSFNLNNWSSFSFFQISENGLRVPMNGHYVDADKQLKLELDLNLGLDSKLSKADQIAGLSAASNTVLLQDSTWHGETSQSFRVELKPNLDQDLITQKVWYYQNTIPISHLELASNSSEIKSELTLKLIEVGFVKARAVDTQGAPIEGALITPILESQTDLGFGQVSLSFHNPYRPVRSKTDKEGHNHVGPIYTDDESAQFRLHAWAPGYCSFVSEPIMFSDIGEKSPIVTLQRCTDDNENAFIASFAKKENTSKEYYDLIEYDLAYTNQDQISLRIDHLKEIPDSGFRVRVYENFAYPYQSDPIFEHEYERFESEISIPTPIAFSTGSALSGSFSIEISPLVTEPSFSTRLLAKKSINLPDLDFLDSFTIVNNTDSENIVSGRDDGEFYLVSERCQEGESLGFTNTIKEAFFAPCEEGRASFKSSEVNFLRDVDRQGGFERIKVYLKDRYGNISENAPESGNEIQIFVDYGIPEINSQSLKLGIQFGFTHIDNILGSGTDLDPYVFPYEDVLVIQAGQMQNYRFGFNKPSNCRLATGSSQDGETSSNLGLEISSFSIQSESSSKVHPCQKGLDETNLIGIDENTIEFPVEPEQDATLTLVVIDLAGNRSAPHTVSIPACGEVLPAQTHACWAP